MDEEEIRKVLETAISDSVSKARAKLETDTKAKLFRMAAIAAYEISTNIEEWDEDRRERAIQEGVDAYGVLLGEMVRLSKLMQMFPSFNEHVLDAALMAKGPNPPFWVR
jgi:hypothetical protein